MFKNKTNAEKVSALENNLAATLLEKKDLEVEINGYVLNSCLGDKSTDSKLEKLAVKTGILDKKISKTKELIEQNAKLARADRLLQERNDRVAGHQRQMDDNAASAKKLKGKLGAALLSKLNTARQLKEELEELDVSSGYLEIPEGDQLKDAIESAVERLTQNKKTAEEIEISKSYEPWYNCDILAQCGLGKHSSDPRVNSSDISISDSQATDTELFEAINFNDSQRLSNIYHSFTELDKSRVGYALFCQNKTFTRKAN